MPKKKKLPASIWQNVPADRITISSILKAFEDIVQVELIKVRWEEIKKLQPNLVSA